MPIDDDDPEIPGPLHGDDPPVTDEDRNRFGVLLDHAAERGLLTPVEYQARLGELAEATSMDELRRIVTELPAFNASVMVDRSKGSKSRTRTRVAPVATQVPSVYGDPDSWTSLTPATARRSRANPWLVLVIVVAVLLVAMVVLGLLAARASHTSGAGPTGSVTLAVSLLRL